MRSALVAAAIAMVVSPADSSDFHFIPEEPVPAFALNLNAPQRSIPNPSSSSAAGRLADETMEIFWSCVSGQPRFGVKFVANEPLIASIAGETEVSGRFNLISGGSQVDANPFLTAIGNRVTATFMLESLAVPIADHLAGKELVIDYDDGPASFSMSVTAGDNSAYLAEVRRTSLHCS